MLAFEIRAFLGFFLHSLLSVFHHCLDHFRHCVGCGKSWGSFKWLCPDCHYLFIRQVGEKRRWISKNIEHRYLVDWSPKDDLKPLVHSLKGGGRVRLFSDWVLFFSKPQNPSSKIYFPSKGKRDHAWDLAQAFQTKWGWEAVPIAKEPAGKQALMSRMERQKKVVFKPQKGPQVAYMADDIVTTGATAKACWKALGQPSKMTVWSVFYRKSL